MNMNFPSCGDQSIGIYPIINSVAWMERLLPLGINSIQLRIKDKPLGFVEQQIQEATLLAKKYHARLFVNDYWQLAIKYDTYGVHLGQEDLAFADCEAMAKANLRLGISSHSQEEMEKALHVKPSYVAFGPIYNTDSKQIAFAPKGIEQLRYYKQSIKFPLVAIGGITLERLSQVLTTGVDGIAMIASIAEAENPELATKTMLEIFENHTIEGGKL